MGEPSDSEALPEDVFIYNREAAQPQIAVLLHSLLTGEKPRSTDEIARIARETGSAGYTQLIAKEAADLVTTWALTTAQVHEVPIVMSRLADFVLLSRRLIIEATNR